MRWNFFHGCELLAANFARCSISARVHKVSGDVRIDQEGAAELGARARGTPRIANRLLQRVRGFAQVNAAPVVTPEMALGALELLQIDACGFDNLDRAILSAIIDNLVGVDTLAAAVGEEADTIGDVYEPYLLPE
jgi:holliday junction DNA helicase RuvB